MTAPANAQVTRAVVSWSGGKDCAWALHLARADASLDVVGLLATCDASRDVVRLHGTPRPLLEAQARALGLPIAFVPLPPAAPNAAYEQAMGAAVAAERARGVRAFVAGDIFLEDVRHYRTALLARHGLGARYPLWGRDTTELAREMIAGGLRATVVAVDPTRVDTALCGRPYDDAFLSALPADVDPCGERGEFHTFVTDMPGFDRPLETRPLGVRDADGMRQCELAGVGLD